MRTIVGAVAVLGLAAAVAGAQPPRERAAAFRPPEPLAPGELPAVARGANEEFPPSSFPSTTPVERPGVAGPAWLTSGDAGVVPAAGIAGRNGNVRALTPPPAARPQNVPPPSIRNFDWLRGGSKKTAPQPQPQPQQPQPQPPEQATAATPFRATSSTGAPVFAGPPAYYWYGYGTVTPGANPFAPTGQFPKASAKWYAITGATPGAFPVPVMNPLRTPPGAEPPTYAAAQKVVPQHVVPVATQPQSPAQSPFLPPPRFQPPAQPSPALTPQPEAPKLPPADSKFPAGVGIAPPPPPVMNVPKLTPPPAAAPVTVAPPVTPAPTAVAVKEPAPLPLPAPMMSEPVAVVPTPVVPPVAVALPVPAVEPAKPVEAAAPSPLPVMVTEAPKPDAPQPLPVTAPPREQLNWQPATEPREPRPGTWAPASNETPLPTMPPPPSEDAWKSGAAPAKRVVVRAQAPDTTDPIAELIRQLCRGRAEGVDIRPSGPRKLMVCFETRTAAEAQKLVTDISRRPELGPYQIDFCVVVK